jgi:pyruvate carboxylase subunit A
VKLVTWGRNRAEAISCMKRAVGEFTIEGVKTNLPFHKVALENESFMRGDYTTNFVEEQEILKEIRRLHRKAAS